MRTLLIAAIALLAACQTNPFNSGPPEKLTDQVRTFEGVVRWGALEKMYAFMKHEPGEVVDIPEGLGNISVTNYELASPLGKLSDTRWTQTAVIDYVLKDRQVVRQLIDQQFWATDDGGKRWYRENPVPQFR